MTDAKINNAAREIAYMAKINTNITAASLRQEAADGMIDGWLEVWGCKQCNFSQWTAAMLNAADELDRLAAQRKAADKIIENDKKVVRKLIRIAKEAGWIATSVNDGEDVVKTSTEAAVMDAVFAVDEAHIRFTKTIDGKAVNRSAFIVLGNGDWCAVADHSGDPVFCTEVADPLYAYCNERELAEA